MRARFLRLSAKNAQALSFLKREAEKDGAHRVARRIHAVLLNHQRHTSGEIAELLEAPRSKVSLWLADYARHGWEALLEGHRSGRPRELSRAQLSQLDGLIDSGPIAYGFSSGVWTSPMIARVIEEEFEVHYHPGHVRKLLKRLGFSVQRPRRKLVKADPVDQDRWQRYAYPRLKKKRLSARRPCFSAMRRAFAKTPDSTRPGRGARPFSRRRSLWNSTAPRGCGAAAACPGSSSAMTGTCSESSPRRPGRA